MDEKIKTWTLRFPAEETLIWRMHCSIGQSCCSMPNYRWISRKFFGHEVFSPERLLNQPNPTRVCIRSINQSNRSISVFLLFLFCSRVFISRSYENRSNTYQLRLRFLSTQNLPWVPEGFCFLLAQLDPHMIALREDGNAMASL